MSEIWKDVPGMCGNMLDKEEATMKDFLLICDKNCATYKEFFHYIKDRKVNIGYTHPGDFDQPEEDNHKTMQGLTRWFTTLSTASKPPLVLTATYSPEKYKHYDNYDAIEVSRIKYIPYDYDWVMGVPITFLDHYNPGQFDIIGILQSSTEEEAGIPILRTYNDFLEMRQDMSFTGASGGKANGNPVILGKPVSGNFLYNEKTGEYAHSVYARVLIRRKKYSSTPKPPGE